MKKCWVFCVLFWGLLYNWTLAQTPESSIDTLRLGELVVSATKDPKNYRHITQSVDVITQKYLQNHTAANTADLLQQTGFVHVQKSQQGGGSPIMRGFEANKILLVVDGIRMNNLIYRGGHLQNIVTLDKNMLQSVELLYGTASTMYGSDALGGVVYLQTIAPKLHYTEHNTGGISGSARVQYASANTEKTVHAAVNYGNNRMAVLGSISLTDYDDLRMGKNRSPFYDTIWGQRFFYVDRMSNRDSLHWNENIYMQRPSGYSQLDALLKAHIYAGKAVHKFNFQLSTSSNVPRYDRLSDFSDGKPRYSEWYYGPQVRMLGAYTYRVPHWDINTYFQQVTESRHTRRFGSELLDHRNELVQIYGVDVDYDRAYQQHQFKLGFEAIVNTLQSTAYRQNIVTTEETSLDTRYPDGKNISLQQALYVTHRMALYDDKLFFHGGMRIGFNYLYAQFINRSFFPFPYTKVIQQQIPFSVQAGVSFLPSERWKITLHTGSGFRSPNTDDISKVFESLPGSIMVPNPSLKPEKTITSDIGVFYEDNHFKIGINPYYTYYFDAIVAAPFQFDGQDSILYDGILSRVLANQNQRRAYLVGGSLRTEYAFSQYVQAFANVNYTRGRILGTPQNTPLDHIPPIYGNVGVRYQNDALYIELSTLFNGKKPLTEYFLNGEDNEQYATAIGMPAWCTFHVSTRYQISSKYILKLGVDNILDTNYRTFASGIHSAGRNVYGAFQVVF
jgi:hemoglobin/transferrin/lactoferrin receptor protein